MISPNIKTAAEASMTAIKGLRRPATKLSAMSIFDSADFKSVSLSQLLLEWAMSTQITLGSQIYCIVA